MSVLEFGLLVLAGIGAGLVGSIAGLASLISYPALLAVGIPPVTANVTNTVALVLNGVGSVSASRPELKGQGRRLLRAGRRRRTGRGGRGRPAAVHPVVGVRADRAVADRRGRDRAAGQPPAAGAGGGRRARAPRPPGSLVAADRHVHDRHLRRLLRGRGRRHAAGDVPAHHRRGPPPRQRAAQRGARHRQLRGRRRIHPVRADRLVGRAAAGDRAVRRWPPRPPGGAPRAAGAAPPPHRASPASAWRSPWASRPTSEPGRRQRPGPVPQRADEGRQERGRSSSSAAGARAGVRPWSRPAVASTRAGRTTASRAR